MSLDQDQCYIEKILGGDSKAFIVLVDRYKYMVLTLAMKILRNREEAEEVAQDVFVKMYQVLHTFKGDSKFSTFLYKIAYNRSLDYLKKRGRSLRTTSIEDFSHCNIHSFENTLTGLEVKERKRIIKNAMDELQEQDNIVITLYYFEELSLKEISEVMGIEVNTVKVRLYRSRKRLAALLKKRLEPETIRTYGGK